MKKNWVAPGPATYFYFAHEVGCGSARYGFLLQSQDAQYFLYWVPIIMYCVHLITLYNLIESRERKEIGKQDLC